MKILVFLKKKKGKIENSFIPLLKSWRTCTCWQDGREIEKGATIGHCQSFLQDGKVNIQLTYPKQNNNNNNIRNNKGKSHCSTHYGCICLVNNLNH